MILLRQNSIRRLLPNFLLIFHREIVSQTKVNKQFSNLCHCSLLFLFYFQNISCGPYLLICFQMILSSILHDDFFFILLRIILSYHLWHTHSTKTQTHTSLPLEICHTAFNKAYIKKAEYAVKKTETGK